MKNRMSLILLGLLGVMIPSAFTSAQVLYSYSRMALKDLDEVNEIIRKKIQESQEAGGDNKVPPLREALQAVFARSNEDGMIEKVLGPLKNELDDLEAWEGSLTGMVEEAIRALQKPDDIKPVAQVTYLIMLENVIQEMRPRAADKFEGGIIAKIRDADIRLSKAAAKERKLKTMKAAASPSEIAEKVLANLKKKSK